MLQGRSEAAEWHDKWEHISKELADVKERAWSLLEEKDLQLQSLKVSLLRHVLQCRLQPGVDACDMYRMIKSHACSFPQQQNAWRGQTVQDAPSFG